MSDSTQERILKALALVLLILIFAGALVLGAHADLDTTKIRGKAMFSVRDVNIKDQYIRIEPMLSPQFDAVWCVDDPCQPLKNVPLAHQIISCNVADLDHEGFHYTELMGCVTEAGEPIGDVFLKTVIF